MSVSGFRRVWGGGPSAGALGGRTVKSCVAAPVFALVFLWGATSYAETLCVEGPGGTHGCAYTLPSVAVAAAVANDVIVIYPGTYQEPATINVTKALKIAGIDPRNTIVTNAVAANVFTVSTGNVPVEISGLTITGGLTGIQGSGSTSLTVHHNLIVFNGQHGIFLFNGPTSLIQHNVVYGNGFNGIVGGDVFDSNIVANNGNVGISATGAIANYNAVFGNTNNNSASGTGNIFVDCLFVGPYYVLEDSSPCKDAGNPSPGLLDVDGSRSDMGVYGGPRAAAFWPYGSGGPVITDLTVDPVIVPRGGTLSINATGEIR